MGDETRDDGKGTLTAKEDRMKGENSWDGSNLYTFKQRLESGQWNNNQDR